jgi:hypothetical protein
MRRLLLVAALAVPAAALSASPEPEPFHEADKKPDRVELASPEVAVPLRMEKGRPIVEVTIDGKGPFPFVLDTGAGGTVIGGDLAKELALPVAGEVHIGDPINPHAIAAKQVRIDRLGLGGATFSGMVATSMENHGFQEHLAARGVLGMPVFQDLLLTIDYGRGQIRIARGELPAPDGKEIIAFRATHGIRVPITLASLELDADLDSGSPAGISLPNRYKGELPLEAPPVEVGHARTVSAEFTVYGATLKGTARIAGYRVENPSLRFNQLPVANLGNDLLRRFVLTIDQKDRRVRFVEAESPSPASDASSAAASGTR